MSKFNIDCRMGFSGLMPDNSVGLAQLMTHVQEASLFHARSIPDALEYYSKMNHVWILTHWQVEILSYPKVGDKINIATWPVRFKGYFGERCFQATDEDDKTLLQANSNWILLDRSTHKPVRPTEEITQKYGAQHPFRLAKDFSMPALDGFVPLSTHKYTTSRRDIDTNNHVNNCKYLEWLNCYIPDEIYANYRAASLKVAYKKEALLGDNLEITLYQNRSGNGDDVEIYAIIEKDGHTATEIHTAWRKDG